MAVPFVFPEEQFVLVGTVAKPHGLRGELRLNSFSADGETTIIHGKFVLVDSQGHLSEPFTVEKDRHQGKTRIVKLAGVDSRESAAELFGRGVLVAKADLPELAENEYYWYQFIGLEVTTDDGIPVGRVHTIFNNGAHDIMVVRRQQQEILIPIIAGVIQKHSKNGVVITPPPGLLELYQRDDG